MMVRRSRGALATAFVASSMAATALMAASACSPSSTSGSAGGEDAANDGGEDGANDPGEGGADAPSGMCEGACKTTSLVADFGGKKRTLVRAQFGTQQGDAGAELHTESHLGGLPACPSPQSPTPDYTLIVSSVPRGKAGQKVSERDGVTSVFFAFKNDLGLPPLTRAITVNVTVVGEDPATPPKWVALDVDAAFREGTVSGHLYAEYCASLND